MNKKLFWPVVAAFAPGALFAAAPMIAVDTPDVNVGVFVEGQAVSVKHTFLIKNTGDSVLVIQNVRPG